MARRAAPWPSRDRAAGWPRPFGARHDGLGRHGNDDFRHEVLMLRDTTVPLARAWNTWSSRPAEMVFLPLGVRVTPLAYADSSRSATLFPAKSVRYGRH